MADTRIENVAIVGAGWMGASVSTVCTIAGYRLTEPGPADRSGGDHPTTGGRCNGTATSHDRAARRGGAGRPRNRGGARRSGREAGVFKTVEPLARNSAVLATNASRIPTTQIASVCQRPERVVGIHFFEPPYILRAVEAIRGERTSDETFETAVAFIESIGSEPIRVVKDREAFVINDLQDIIRRESTPLTEAGVAEQGEIERAALNSFGIKIAALGQFKTGRVKSRGPGYEYSDEGLAEVKRRSFALIEVARAAKRAQAMVGGSEE